MIILYSVLNKTPGSEAEISYTEFLDMVDAEEIRKLVMQDQMFLVVTADGRRFNVFTPRDINLLTILKQKGVAIQVKPLGKPA